MRKPLRPTVEIGISCRVTLNGEGRVPDVVEVRIAYPRVFIPPVHGVDHLGQLCAASFVYTASVHPQPLILVPHSLLTAIQDLPVAEALANLVLLLPIYLCKVNHLLVIDFINPLMR